MLLHRVLIVSLDLDGIFFTISCKSLAFGMFLPSNNCLKTLFSSGSHLAVKYESNNNVTKGAAIHLLFLPHNLFADL